MIARPFARVARGLALTGVALVGPVTLAACGGEDVAQPRVRAPALTIARTGEPSAALDAGRSDASVSPAPSGEPMAAPASDSAFGVGSVVPGERQPFFLALDIRALRASPTGATLARTLSRVPDVVRVKERVGVDVFADGTALLVYGPTVAVPGANANVVRHARAEAEVDRAIARAGLDAIDGGPPRAVRAQLFGAREAVVRPQAGMLAFVPLDRAGDVAAVLAKSVDTGLRPGDLLRVTIEHPGVIAPAYFASLARATITARPANDGGFDVSASADCGGPDACKRVAEDLRAVAQKTNSMMVRMATGNLLGPLTREGAPPGEGLRADGSRLHAVLHASPEQVRTVDSFLRAALGLPMPPAPDGGIAGP